MPPNGMNRINVSRSPKKIRLQQKQQQQVKEILLWNSHYSRQDYGFGIGREPFVLHKCEEDRCSITTDRSRFYQADVVVFHTAQLRRHLMPPRPRVEQVWVSYNKENPLRTGVWAQGLTDMFNLTLSYLVHKDTDIKSPIGYVRKLTENDITLAIPSFERIRQKTKSAAWVVSNCQAQSTRNDYAKELSRHLHLDVFGNCSDTPCPGSYGHPECFKAIERDYFFYLAFENGFCIDYITEKLYRTLLFDLVPIVLGGGDYLKQVPRHSVIDVRDFASPKELAHYLMYLQNHTREYQKYFEWRKVYTVPSQAEMKRDPLCRLCQILHNRTYVYKQNFNFGKYWNSSEQCLTGNNERLVVNLPSKNESFILNQDVYVRNGAFV
jgi:alpha-1,3-fucosyltransferase